MTLDDLASAVLGGPADPLNYARQSFISLGGDSLRAIRLVAMAREQLSLEIPVKALLGGEALADALAQAREIPPLESASPGSPEKPGRPGEAADGNARELSPAQRGMWLLESVTGGSPYNLVFTARVERGDVDPAALSEAIAATVARHEGLRTVFTEDDGGVSLTVADGHSPDIREVRFEGDPAAFADYVRRTAAEEGRRPFDLSAAPGVRFLHLRDLAGKADALALIAHHTVLDGWSVGYVLREIFSRHDGLRGKGVPAPGPGTPLKALLRHQEEQEASGLWDRQAEFWSRHLAGIPAVLELPADTQRPAVQDPAGARLPLDLGTAVTGAAGDRARALGITPFAFLLGAFGLTLSRMTGARSLLVGVPLLGRDTAELEELVGVAGNLVPVRIDVDDGMTTAEFLRSVQRSLSLSMDAGHVPFEELVTRLGLERTVGCHPLVQVCFGMHDQLVPRRLTTRSLDIRIEEGHGGGSQFDLTLLVGQSEPALAGHLEYATSVWSRPEADAFIAGFTAGIGELSAGDSPLEDVRCMAPGQRARLAELNAVRAGFPATSVDQLFRDVARRAPDAIAVRDGDAGLTYGQLALAASEQARLLREAGVRPGDTVLIGVERSIAEAVAVLGVLTAGGAYVGADLSLPPAHTEKIVRKAAPAAVLARPGAAGHPALRGITPVPVWDASWSPAEWSPAEWSPAEDGLPPVAPEPSRRAYVAFTSGSTGEPKGVVVPHRAVIRLVHDADYVRTGPGETMLRLSPLAFDASTLELWGALLTGATLEVYPAETLPSPTELGTFLRARKVTVAWLTAGLFRLVQEFSPDAFGGLRQLITGGDVVPHEHAARALRAHPGLVITNGYGPTENTTFTATHTVRAPRDISGPLPIGTPVPGTRVYVLDERGRVVPPGAVGELYTGGEGLADGYIGDETETARRFGRFSADVPERLYRTGDLTRVDTRGRLTFLGRADDQVKLRGYRIELSAISEVLAAHEEVQDAIVVAVGTDSADKRLVAAVVLAPGATIGTAGLRDHLSGTLPGYMVPALWAVVDTIPVTANGKTDRERLAGLAAPAGSSGAPGAAAARDVLEQVIGLFAESAREAGGHDGAPDITADSDFFTLGGTSLGAVQLIRLLKETFGTKIRLRDLLLDPTPGGVALLVARQERG